MGSNDSGAAKGLFIGLTLGFVAGALTALFLTPKTGEELRTDIRRITKDVANKVEEKAKRIRNITKEKYNEVLNNVIESYKKVKDLTDKEIEFIKKVVAEQKDISK
jgi:gas vesicle protein